MLREVFLKKFLEDKSKHINAEMIFNDSHWLKMKNSVSKKYQWFIPTPANYPYFKFSYNLNLSEKEFKDLLTKRIQYLKNNNQIIQLSIFLGKDRLSLKKRSQEIIFRDAIKFFKSLEIEPTSIYIYDKLYDSKTYEIIKKYGINKIIDFNILTPSLKLLIKKLGLKESLVEKIVKNYLNKDYQEALNIILAEAIKVKKKTIHVENIVNDNIWNNLMKKVVGQNFIWFIITPANYNYCKTYFNLNISKEKFQKVLTKRINTLKSMDEEIQLHIHLGKKREFLDDKLQKHMFEKALAFFHSLDIIPKKFAPGWWTYDHYTIELLRSYGFTELYDYSSNPLNDFYRIKKLSIQYVHKYWHDFDFI